MDTAFKISRVYEIKSRDAMREVFSSYANENYRSAANSLYSAVIVDLALKLQTLATIYDSKTAAKILACAQEKANKKDFDSSWEQELIDHVYTQTNLINNKLYTDLVSLKKYRNLSSHPTITEQDVNLPSPNPDIILGLINDVMTHLMQNAPVFIGNILDEFTDTLAEHEQTFLLDNKQLDDYINVHYLFHLNSEQVNKLVDGLFKFSFCKTNDQAINNHREINFLALILVNKNKNGSLQHLTENVDLLNKIETLDEDVMNHLKRFVTEFPSFIQALPNIIIDALKKKASSSLFEFIETPQIFGVDYHDLIQQVINSWNDENAFNNMATQYSLSFNQDDLMDSTFSLDELTALKMHMDNNSSMPEYKRLMIFAFSQSDSFDQASRRITYINSIIDKCSVEDLEDILDKSEQNSQIYFSFTALPFIQNVVFSQYEKLSKKSDAELNDKVKNNWRNLSLR